MCNNLEYMCYTSKLKENDFRNSLNETNDCAVKSISTIFDISYDDAHNFCKEKLQRRNRRGVKNMGTKLRSLIYTYGGIKFNGMSMKVFGDYICPYTGDRQLKNYYKVRGELIPRQMTVGTFVKEHNKGRFLLLVRGHAFCVIDGIIYGNISDSFKNRVRINDCYKIS